MQQKEELVKEAKRRYYRRYRKNNKERIQANTENFWKRKAEELLLEIRCMPQPEDEADNDNVI